MRSILLSACAAIALMFGVSVASADDYRYYNNDYYDNGGYGYSQEIVSPRSIVQDLRYQGFSNISRPALAGQFYQVKARDPNGHRVKLYIDAYSGRIVKVKG
jgi:hypothetical protein